MLVAFECGGAGPHDPARGGTPRARARVVAGERRSLWIVRAGVYSGSVDTDRLSHISTTFVDLLHF